jgi:hypothetical protein
MLIIGLGQYPNLGVTDAFALASHGDTHRVVRASRRLARTGRTTRQIRSLCWPGRSGTERTESRRLPISG